MLSTIQLDDELSLEADKIDDVRADDLLAAEFIVCESVAAQMSPQQSLCVG
ncbi:MAG TPA: hypothetical protein VEV20_10910 [Burkholderiales bacterium]|nr:hypothetical protein [Burkholderiales bacterium]